MSTDNISKTSPPREALPGLITKESEHPLGVMLLGEVVGAMLRPDGAMLLYFGDRRVTRLTVNNGQLNIAEHTVVAC